MSRPTNRELVDAFRRLLTEAAKESFALNRSPAEVDKLLADTKLWRGQLWNDFHEIERRLCPQPPKKVENASD